MAARESLRVRLLAGGSQPAGDGSLPCRFIASLAFRHQGGSHRRFVGFSPHADRPFSAAVTAACVRSARRLRFRWKDERRAIARASIVLRHRRWHGERRATCAHAHRRSNNRWTATHAASRPVQPDAVRRAAAKDRVDGCRGRARLHRPRILPARYGKAAADAWACSKGAAVPPLPARRLSSPPTLHRRSRTCAPPEIPRLSITGLDGLRFGCLGFHALQHGRAGTPTFRRRNGVPVAGL